MDDTHRTSACPRCGTATSEGQRFCRRCGTQLHQMQWPETDSSAPTTERAPEVTAEPLVIDAADLDARPMSRAVLALIALIFLVIGGVLALIVARADDWSPRPPTSSSSSQSSHTSGSSTTALPQPGTRPITSTDWPKGGEKRVSTHRADGTMNRS